VKEEISRIYTRLRYEPVSQYVEMTRNAFCFVHSIFATRAPLADGKRIAFPSGIRKQRLIR
jgi:hypothetical protein